MERAEWLKQMRSQAEALYDRLSPLYWVTFGFYENQTHLAYLKKFLEQVGPGMILSAGCGAGRYDGLLLEAGHSVLGIDQSAGMLAQAQEHARADARQYAQQIQYQKLGLQEITFREVFDGVICIDALEHVCPEDYPGILNNFQQALKPGGMLYFTMDRADPNELEEAYQRALAKGLPVIFGEVADQVDPDEPQVSAAEPITPTPQIDAAVYHFYPSMDQAHAWIKQAGLVIEAEGEGSGYYHFLARKTP